MIEFSRLFIAALLLTTTIVAEETQPTLSVRGEATLFKPANELNISIGVVTENTNAEIALKDNSQKMEAVITALNSLGITDKEYSTGRFNILPTYTPHPKNPPPDWRQKINGYRVTNSLTIKTDKLSKTGQMIDAANKAGANSIDNIYFSLKDLRHHRQEAIETATKNAITDATSLASSADIKLIRILSIKLDDAAPPQPQFKLASRAASFNASTPIEAGDVTIDANVTIVYEID